MGLRGETGVEEGVAEVVSVRTEDSVMLGVLAAGENARAGEVADSPPAFEIEGAADIGGPPTELVKFINRAMHEPIFAMRAFQARQSAGH